MNIYDIAKKANVSPATVSRVLNGNQSVREKTRKKVQQIIDESNYVPNSLARSLSVGDIRNIAFLAPDIENSFFSKILHDFGLRQVSMIIMCSCMEPMMIWR